MRKFLEHNTPPGIDTTLLRSVFGIGMLLSSICSCGFIARYQHWYHLLQTWYTPGHAGFAEANPSMPPFNALLGSFLFGFVMLALIMLGFVIYHYFYCRQGSKSVYLLRRLPQKWEYHRRCWLVPVLCAATALLTGLVLGLIDLAVYLNVTPEHLLPDQIWQFDWRE